MSLDALAVCKNTKEYRCRKPQYSPYYRCIEDNYEAFERAYDTKYLQKNRANIGHKRCMQRDA
jgi:hypothetical protein